MENQTIVSQATPMGQSSVAVIRISGPTSFNIAKKLTGSKRNRAHHEVALLFIKNDKGVDLDRGLFTFFIQIHTQEKMLLKFLVTATNWLLE